MYKVMIVDDEPLVRMTMHQMIVWKELDMEIVAEANDGLEALAILQARNDIDILLLDIQMPKMNGIELLGAIQSLDAMKKPIPIILSAYRDFSYVREAFLLGAFDYIVKVDMDEEYMLPVLQKARQKLEKLGASNDSQVIHEEKVGTDKVIAGLLTLDIQSNVMAYARIVSEVCNWLGEINQVAVAVSLSSPAEMTSKKAIKQTIKAEMDSAVFKHIVYDENPNEIFILLTVPQLRSEIMIRERIHAALSLIKTRLEQYMNIRVAMGISDIVDGRKHWQRLMNQARGLVSLSFFEGYDKFFYPESEIKLGKETSADLRIKLKAKSMEIVRLLQQEYEVQWELEFDRSVKLLKEKARWDVHETRLILIDFLWELGALLYTQDVRWGGVFDHCHPFEQLKEFHTFEDTIVWIKQVCSDIYRYIHELSPKTNAPYSIVEKAKEFIHQHYCEELSLNMVSQWVGVSENYLSRLFMKNVGESFVQYLTNLRIEESKRLLKKGYKIIDLSEKIGYVNAEHFSRVFKKVTGVSPKVYKERLGLGTEVKTDRIVEKHCEIGDV
ncbi:Protein-glutamate methylesterase/protein-glutamine glutaminase [Paenibacillus allorhizoplanae]|uniref:Protein-glutamate methylesterase/protein-glutamine glutaminase n=1 Tax=Paenibacillus allorhizoplanae TaxID=2905648 RepID=A0ABM9BRC8_9BACL|nr:response regulator [Paenibacillus allorhizoplanae]CAH1193186.1 Protein-glutamate methylesterase/protein-glutamine glutaminase [Paenibacillus allorhizoplanae]